MAASRSTFVENIDRTGVAFVCGAIAVLTFHQATWALFDLAGAVPAGNPAWPIEPVQPFGLPRVLAFALWGGAWALPLLLLLEREPQSPAYWIRAALYGGVGMALVTLFVVLPMRGLPFAGGWKPGTLGGAFVVNAAWSLGTALLLRLSGLIPTPRER